MGSKLCCPKIISGVILNESDFVAEYIVSGKDDNVHWQINQNNNHLNMVQTSGGSQLSGFFKESEQETQSFQSKNIVYRVNPGQHSMYGLQSLVSDQNRISVRVRIGQFVKNIVNSVVIKHQRDGCLKITKNLSVECMESSEAQQVFKRSIIKSSIRPLKEAKEKCVKGSIQQQALKLLQQEYQKQKITSK